MLSSIYKENQPPQRGSTPTSRKVTRTTWPTDNVQHNCGFSMCCYISDLPSHFTSTPTALYGPVTYDTVTQSGWHNLRPLPIRYSHYNGTTSFTLCKVPAV